MNDDGVNGGDGICEDGSCVSRLDGQIADCSSRIDQAHEKVRELDKAAGAYDEAHGVIVNWIQQISGVSQDLHQCVRGDVVWRQLEQDDEERMAEFNQARSQCLEAYDELTERMKREHMSVLDIESEQENLYRVRNEYEDEEQHGRNFHGSDC